MTADKLADAILNKCDIYYGGALISKEAIIEKYLAFFAKSLVSKERTTNFALHTGSVCFDVISVVAVALGCLSYNLRKMMTLYLRFSLTIWFSSRGNDIVGKVPDLNMAACA